jgi:hypothetical protein
VDPDRSETFLQDPDPELIVMDPDPELDLNLIKNYDIKMHFETLNVMKIPFNSLAL